MPAKIAIMAMQARTKWQSPGRVGIANMATMAAGKKPKSSELKALIARRLKAARQAFEPNAAAVARALDVTPQTLNKYEQGVTFPDELFLVRFCDLTGVPADFIFRGRFPQEMPVVLAARIGVLDPDLVPAAPPSGVKAGQELESASGQGGAD